MSSLKKIMLSKYWYNIVVLVGNNQFYVVSNF